MSDARAPGTLACLGVRTRHRGRHAHRTHWRYARCSRCRVRTAASSRIHKPRLRRGRKGTDVHFVNRSLIARSRRPTVINAAILAEARIFPRLRAL
jgi:hypothetical protein